MIASERKAWPKGVASRPKISTCDYLPVHLIRSLVFLLQKIKLGDKFPVSRGLFSLYSACGKRDISLGGNQSLIEPPSVIMDWGPKKWMVQSCFDLSTLFVLFLHMINCHVSSIFFEIYISVTIFTRLNWAFPSYVRETSLPESYKILSKKWNRNLRAEYLEMTRKWFLGCCVFARVVRKYPDCFFRFVLLVLLVTRDWHPTSFEFSTHAQHVMSRRLLPIPDLSRSRKIEGELNVETLEKQEKRATVQIKFHNLIIWWK